MQTGINDRRDFTDIVCVRITQLGARRFNCCSDGFCAKLDGLLWQNKGYHKTSVCLNYVMKDSGQQICSLCSLNELRKYILCVFHQFSFLSSSFFFFFCPPLFHHPSPSYYLKLFYSGIYFESLSEAVMSFDLVLFHPPFKPKNVYALENMTLPSPPRIILFICF